MGQLRLYRFTLVPRLSGSYAAERTERVGIGREAVAGFRFLVGHRDLRTLAAIVAVANLASAAALAVFVLYAVTPGPMGLSPAAFALIGPLSAVGGLTASAVVSRITARLGQRRTLAVALAASALPFAVAAITPDARLVVPAFVVGSAAAVVWNILTVTLRQRVVPDALLGRVNATYRLLAFGAIPIGAALGGAVSSAAGLPALFAMAAVLTVAMLPLVPLASEPASHVTEDTAEARP
jgi:MFS family permease